MVTTYWGFYIDPDIKKALLERLVIDPIFFYLVMLLLVPLSFGFTYMMIKLAKNAEANKKLQPKKATGKSSINLSQKWIYIIFISLLGFQVYLNIMAYYAVLNGMKNFSLFIIGVIMIVFAGMFHIYRHGRTMAKAPPPPPSKPLIPPTAAKTSPLPPKPAASAPSTTQRPLAAPPVQKATGNQPSSSTSNPEASSKAQATGTKETEGTGIHKATTSSSIPRKENE
jgi:ubiquinol-cytochrome c reductase cytochrome b subunit